MHLQFATNIVRCNKTFVFSSSEFPKPCVPDPDPLSSVGSNEYNIQSLPKCNENSYEPPLRPTTNPTSTSAVSGNSFSMGKSSTRQDKK